ncbi:MULTISPECIES: peptidase inhibitor family I36 protein [Streptomyces]|uniref:peptidase inhibitor family I36 protein n=1 Tax=Streptomyces TaxID=1883 RepID=UPI001D152D12|nr:MULTISPECIES: peptidase inhibitor family I36 protein [Streptomyces]MCC3651189.1 peptidase inhibitor family I36 protein [Streptomyces sp. S07_1.15]WSQ73993.1 peptidase inhibitor family I36 protein [Streptomyces xinghaiensis]
MKRTLFTALGSAALLSAAALAAPAAGAAESGAQAAYFTIYQHDNKGGGWCNFTRDDSSLANNYWTNASGACNDGASSMRNNLSRDVVLYQTSGYAGDNYFARKNSEDNDFSNNNFDNKASSVDVR